MKGKALNIREKAKDEAATASRFVLVGIVNTIVGCSIMFGLYNLAGWGYWTSSATNFILTSILSFFLNKNFTFKHKGGTGKSALRFACNIAACYILAYGIAKPAMLILLKGASVTVRENLAMLAGLILFTVFNYLGQRLFAFK